MSTELISVYPDMSCEEVMDLMLSNRISGVPVVEPEGMLVGVITMYDLIDANMNYAYSSTYFQETQLERQLQKEGLHLEKISEGFVSDFMVRNVYTAKAETRVEELARQMFKHRIHRIIITEPDSKKPIGIVTTFDLLKLMAEGSSFEDLIEETVDSWIQQHTAS
jgi:CBS domain-containing protein